MFKNKVIKAIIATFAFLFIFEITSVTAEAYYCRPRCKNEDLCWYLPTGSGGCNLMMSCDPECDGHRVEPCFLFYTAPTCTTAGSALVEHCVATANGYVCHEKDRWDYYAPLGHSYGIWTADNETTHSRRCTRCGDTQTAAHTFVSTPIGWVDDGDKHITTYRRDCTGCGFSTTETVIEDHNYSTWHGEGNPAINNQIDTMTRTCADCGHYQSEFISIDITNRDVWTSESVTITGTSDIWSDCGHDTNTLPTIQKEQITATNIDNTSDTLTQLGHSMSESREGRYSYTYEYWDNSGATLALSNHMSIELGNALIDHSAPQLTVSITVAGVDTLGVRPSSLPYQFTNDASTMSGYAGVNSYETKWVNEFPTITVTATDLLKDSAIAGAGVHSIIIYDDEGYVVTSSNGADIIFNLNGPSNSFNGRYEGTHTFTIVATDNLCRDYYRFGDTIANERSVYTLTGSKASANYHLGDVSADYDVNHVTIAQVTTHVDITPPVIYGSEDLFDANTIPPDDSNHYVGSNTVYIQDNVIEEVVTDFAGTANDSSDIAYIVLVAYDKSGNRTLLSSIVRDSYDTWDITQLTDDCTRYGSGLTFSSRGYTKEDMIPFVKTAVGVTITRPESFISNIRVNTDPTHDDIGGVSVPYNPVTDAMLGEARNNYEYYVLQAMDIAGNRMTKKLVPQYAELRTIKTVIDPSTYFNPDGTMRK